MPSGSALIEIASWSLAGALAFLVGHAAHRGGICMVRAVAEPLSTGRAHMALALVETAAWTSIVMMPLAWWVLAGAELSAFGLGWHALWGGFVFGVGAGINNACAISTATRLGNGELAKLGTVAGMVLGALALAALRDAVAWPPAPRPVASFMLHPGAAALVVYALIAVGVAWAGLRLLRERAWRRRDAASGRWPLGLSALLMGAANAVICARAGSWTYTAWLGQAGERVALGDAGPALGAAGPLLFGALLAGVAVSAWQRGTLSADPGTAARWARALTGGTLMGLGAATAPGGNTSLILHMAPAASPHVAPALLGLVAGILAVVGARRAFGAGARVDCGGRICRAEPRAP